MEVYMQINNANSPIIRSESILINKFRVNDIFTMLYKQNKQLHKHDIKLLVPIYYDICMKCLYKYLIKMCKNNTSFTISNLNSLIEESLLSDNYNSNDFDIIFHQSLLYNFEKLYYKTLVYPIGPKRFRRDIGVIKSKIHKFYLPTDFINPIYLYFKNTDDEMLSKNELGIARYIIDYEILAINNGLCYNKFIKLIEIVFDILEKYVSNYKQYINTIVYDVNIDNNLNISIDYKLNEQVCMMKYRVFDHSCIDKESVVNKLTNILSGSDKIKNPAEERIINEISELKTIEGRFRKYVLSEFRYDFTSVRRLKIIINDTINAKLFLTIPEWSILIKSISYIIDYRILCLKLITDGLLVDSYFEEYDIDTELNIQTDHARRIKTIAYLSNISDCRLMEFLIEYYKTTVSLGNILELMQKLFSDNLYLYRLVNFDKITKLLFIKDRFFYNFTLSTNFHNINFMNEENHTRRISIRKCLKFFNIEKFIRHHDRQVEIIKIKSYIRRYNDEILLMFINVYGSNLSFNDNIEKYSELTRRYRQYWKQVEYRERGVWNFPYVRLNNNNIGQSIIQSLVDYIRHIRENL